MSRNTICFDIHPKEFKEKLLTWIDGSFDIFFFLDSSGYPSKGFIQNEYGFLAGIGELEKMKVDGSSFESLKQFQNQCQDWMFGYFSYDLKNEIESLSSSHADDLKFPEIYFFRPKIVIEVKDFQAEISCFETDDFIRNVFDTILSTPIKKLPLKSSVSQNKGDIKSRMQKEEYIDAVKEIQNHIKKGDIYELNFCQEFYLENVTVESLFLYSNLIEYSHSPYSAFCKMGSHQIISASPERFLKKEKMRLISQPIKGTIRRGKNEQEDNDLKEKLFHDPKERSENVMIVDLVRNDLSHYAQKNSVQVEELFGIYTFGRVHQMISTVSALLDEEENKIDAIKKAFPMGSMTGAPKVKAMQLIEKYETRKRGLYSGALGYFKPDGDFDFNVVIRSILYEQTKKILSFHTGSAITYYSDAEKEYEECLLKATTMLEALNL